MARYVAGVQDAALRNVEHPNQRVAAETSKGVILWLLMCLPEVHGLEGRQTVPKRRWKFELVHQRLRHKIPHVGTTTL